MPGSLFNLNEIIFGSEQPGALADPSASSRFDLNTYRYPSSLGNGQYGHYMLFDIYVRENINPDFGVETRSGSPTDYIIRKALSQTRGGGSVSGALNSLADTSLGSQVINSIQSAASNFSDPLNSINNLFGGSNSDIANRADTELTSINELFGGPNSAYATRAKTRASGLANRAFEQLSNDAKNAFNTLKRATDMIALYMPDTLNFDYNHSYKDLALSENPLVSATQRIAAAANMAGGKLKGLSPFLVDILSSVSPQTGELGQAVLGFAINPQFEVVYQATSLRNFQFDFMFYPRDEGEATQVQNIISAFKFHAAPEIISGGGGRYLLAPSAFDIGFFYNGKRNVNLPRISTCVCENVMVDYAPNGWSAYEVQGQNTPYLGGTGMPVGIRLQLRFKEMTMVTKELLRSAGSFSTTLNEGNLDARGASF
jgi:hypothetical protein